MISFDFWPDGLTVMTRHAIDLLRLAGEPVTNANIIRLVESVPRSREHLCDRRWREESYCNRCLAAASAVSEKDSPRFRPLVEYFVHSFIERPAPAQALLIQSFRAILGTIERER